MTALAAGVFCGCAPRQTACSVPVIPSPAPVSHAAPDPAELTLKAAIPVVEPAAVATPVVILGDKSLFDGQTLSGWKITDYGGRGEVEVRDGQILVGMGAELTGIHWTNAAALPRQNYEIELEAMKLQGTDFFCGLTFPVGDAHATLVCGGWGGGVLGISSIDFMDASENDTSRTMYFEPNKWHRIRLRVLPKALAVWIDDKQVVDVAIEGRRISMRPGDIEMSTPLGITTWQTASTFRNITLRSVPDGK